MKKDLKRCGEILRVQLLANVVLVAFNLSLFALIDNIVFLTVVSGCIYLSAIYLAGWNEGFRDSRNIGDVVPDIPRALKAVLYSAILPAVFLALRIVAYHHCVAVGAEMTAFLKVTDIIYRLWYFYLAQFMHKGWLFIYILPIIIQVGVYVGAYAVGLRRFDLSEKIMPKILYKKNEKK